MSSLPRSLLERARSHLAHQWLYGDNPTQQAHESLKLAPLSIPPHPGPGWRFNAPPGWPAPPDGWVPTAVWAGPEDDWPEAPPYWLWWIRDNPGPAASQVNAVAKPTAPPAVGTTPIEKPDPSRARRLAVLVTVFCAVLVALVAAVVLPSNGRSTDSAAAVNDTVAAPADSGAVPPPSEEPTEEPVATPTSSAAHDQAVAIDDLLDLSGPSRNALRDAITQVLHCDRVAKAIKTLQKVADERGRQLTRAKDLTVDALDDGQELKQSLIAAFSAWAGPCRPAGRPRCGRCA